MRLHRPSRVRSSRGHVRIPQSSPGARWATWAVAAGLVLLTLIIATQLILPAFQSESKPSRNNRTWLEFAWTTTPVDQNAVAQLAQRLESNYINEIYLEASAWRSDGSLLEGEHAAEFAQALRAAYPELRVLLWLRMSGEQVGQPAVQKAVADLAIKAVSEWDFDGVQLNGRAVVNGSESFVQLVRRLREVIGGDVRLSITVPPDRIPTDPDVPIGANVDPALTWDVNYKQRVGLLLVDEIVIMAHASGLADAEQYESWVAYQVVSYTSVLAELEQPPEIIVALPTYEAAPEHDPAIEEIRPAIQGVERGVDELGSAKKWVKGVGLFEYKTTDALEWAYYREKWLGLKSD